MNSGFASHTLKNSLYALCSLVPIGVAQAQVAMDQQARVLEEVTVYATRRASNLQDTSAAVTSFTDQKLREQSIHTMTDLGLLSPGLEVASYQGDTSIYIRGIGTPTIIAGADSSTATYVDGVYISRPAAIGPAFFDIERVEVLRGPQGTLYGRNATGGAVSITTKGPDDILEGNLDLTVGSDNQLRLLGAVGGPITDTLGGRIAMQMEQRDGYTRAIRADNSTDDIDDKDDLRLRAHLRWDISESASLSLIGDYYEADDKAAVFHFASTGYAEEFDDWYNTREGSQTQAYFAYRSGARVSQRGSRDLYTDVEYKNEIELWGVTGRLDWRFPAFNLAVIGSYRDTNPSLQNEFDSSDAFVIQYNRAEDHWQRSLDFQFSSNGEGKFSWIAGATAFEEENVITNDIFGDFWEPVLVAGFTDLQEAGVIPTFPISLPQTELCCTLQLNGEQETEAYAAYFEGTYEFNDYWSIKFGGRQSWEERDGEQHFQLLFAGERFAPNTLFFPDSVSTERGAVPDPLGLVVGPVNGPEDFDSFTPMFVAEYRPTEGHMMYALAQKGFKSGGYNIGSGQMDPYDEEDIWSYELGAKSEFLDRRLRVNSALFFYQYENLQAQDSVGNQPIIRNVGEAEVKGFEIEFLTLASEAWQFDGSVTYLDAQFTEGELTEPLRPAPPDQPPGSAVRDLDGLSLPRAPEWKVHIGAQFQHRLEGLGTLSVRADYVWQDKVYYTVFNIDSASQDAYGVTNARLSFDSEDMRWSMAIFGKNLTDESYFSNQILTGTVYGAEFVGSLAPPRTYGIEASYRF